MTRRALWFASLVAFVPACGRGDAAPHAAGSDLVAPHVSSPVLAEPVAADVALPARPRETPGGVIRAPGRVVFASGASWADARSGELLLPKGATDATWVTVDPASLEIQRGSLAFGVERLPAEAVRTHEGPRHRCVAYRTEQPGFTVACVVREGAFRIAGASFDADRRAFPVVQTPAGRVVVLDLSLGDADARSQAFAYVSGDEGVVVHADASHLDGEIAPSLSLGGASRRQPARHLMVRHWHHPPHLDDFFLGVHARAGGAVPVGKKKAPRSFRNTGPRAAWQ